MGIIISLSAAIAPALFLVIYFYKKDTAKPEPVNLIVKTFFLGIAATVPIIIIELIIGNFERIFIYSPFIFFLFRAFIIAALCEEGTKLAVIKLFIYNRKEFDEITDGIIYTITVSLGFAAFENVLYVLNGNLMTAVLRAFTAVPLHAIASGLMGYYVGKSKFTKDKHKQKEYIKRGFLTAFFIHGYYNFVIFAIPIWGNLPALTNIILLIFGFLHLRSKLKSAINEDIKTGRVKDPEGHSPA